MKSFRAQYWRVPLKTAAILILLSCQPTPPTAARYTIPAPTQTSLSVSPTRNHCAAPQEWSLSFTLSGGFAGEQKNLQVTSGGRLVAADMRLGKQSQTSLDEDALTSITQLLEDACPFPDIGRLPSCADCFVYSIDMNWGSERHTFVFNDINLPESGFGRLIAKLNELREIALQAEQD